MRTKKIRNRWVRAGVTLFAVISVLLVAAQVFLTFYLNPLIENVLRDIVVKGSDGLYVFEAKRIRVSVFNGSIRVKDLEVKVDSNRYRDMRAKKALPPLVLDLHLGNGRIKGIRFIPLLFDREVRISDIVCTEADIHFSRHFYQKEQDTTAVPTAKTFYQSIQNDIKGIYIKQILFDKFTLSVQNADSAKAFKFRLEQCRVNLQDIAIDSASSIDKDRLLYARDLDLEIQQLQVKTSDGMYSMGAKAIRYSFLDRQVEVEGFLLKPLLSKAAFYKKVQKKKDMFNISVAMVQLRRFDIKQLIGNNALVADSVVISKPDVQVYTDLNYPRKDLHKKKLYLTQLLQSTDLGIVIYTTTIADGRIHYTQKNAKTQQEGSILFEHIRGKITNITNLPLVVALNPRCNADLYTTFLGKSKLHAQFVFPLDKKDGTYSATAELTNLSAKELSPVVTSLTGMKLQSMNIQQLNYVVQGNEKGATGNLRLQYTDLKVELTKDDGNNGRKSRKLLSYVANKLVLWEHNPMPEKPQRKADRFYTSRDYSRPFFNQVWRNLSACAGEIVLQRKIKMKK